MVAVRIERFEDVLRALRENPEWLEELRVLILTEELLALPARFTGLEQRMSVMDERQDRMERRMDRIQQRLDDLMGEAVERRYRRNAVACFSRIARRIRYLTIPEREDLLDQLEDEGRLTPEEADLVRFSDGVFRGRRDGAEVRLLLEASYTVELGDVGRAAERAGILQRATGLPVLAVVAGEQASDDVAAAAAKAGVWLVTDGRVAAPA